MGCMVSISDSVNAYFRVGGGHRNPIHSIELNPAGGVSALIFLISVLLNEKKNGCVFLGHVRI